MTNERRDDSNLYGRLLRTDFIGQLLRNVPPKLHRVPRVEDLPAAGPEWQRAIAVVSDGSDPDDLVVCLLTAAPDTYEWVSLATEGESATASLYIPASAFASLASGPALSGRGSGATGTRMAGWALDASTAEYVGTSFTLPSDYSGGGLSFEAFFAPSSSGAGAARLFVYPTPIEVGDQIDVSPVLWPGVGHNVAMPGVADQMVSQTYSSLFWSGVDPGQPVRCNVYRAAAGSEDTYADDVWFLGLRVDYGTG